MVGHEGSIRELHFCLPDQPQLLHSCAADGSVRGWDTRSGQQVER
jgi:WD40 repeat protein